MNQEQIVRYHLSTSALQGTTSDDLLHEPWNIRSLFLSDVHLGYSRSMAQQLVSLLNHIKTEYIYLNGDIVDGWSLGITGMHHIGRLFKPAAQEFSLRIPQSQADVTQKLLRHARSGTYIFYIPGNHDAAIRPHLRPMRDVPEATLDLSLKQSQSAGEKMGMVIGEEFNELMQIGKMFFLPNIVHKTADNRRFMVMHGDEFDSLIREWRTIGILGTKARDKIFGISEWLSRNDEFWLVRQLSRRILGLNEKFSLADYIDAHKSETDLALPSLSTAFIKTRNELLTERGIKSTEWAKEPGLDGIIVGHNHIPDSRRLNGVQYFNSGSWVKPTIGGTALIEHIDGRMQLICWNDEKGILPFTPQKSGPSNLYNPAVIG